MNADVKFQTLVTHVETILAAENVQWAEYTATAKKKPAVPALLRFLPRTQMIPRS